MQIYLLHLFIVSGSWRPEARSRGSGVALLPAEGLDEKVLPVFLWLWAVRAPGDLMPVYYSIVSTPSSL